MRYLAILLIALLIFEGVQSESTTAKWTTAVPAKWTTTTTAVGYSEAAGGTTAVEAETTAAGGETTAAGGGTTGAGAETTAAGGETTETWTWATEAGGTDNQICPNNKRTNDKIRKKALDMTNWRSFSKECNLNALLLQVEEILLLHLMQEERLLLHSLVQESLLVQEQSLLLPRKRLTDQAQKLREQEKEFFEGVQSECTTATSGGDTTTAPDAGGETTTAPTGAGVTTDARVTTGAGITTGAGVTTGAGAETTSAEEATTGSGAETTGAGETGESTSTGGTIGAGTGETTTGGGKQTEATVAPANNQICPNNKRTNDKIRKKALDMTNWRRSQLALGQVVKRNGVAMPTAANMQKLRYDCELELKARDRAEACEALESDGSTADYQENRYYIPKSDVASAESPRVDAMAASIEEWWKRVRLDDPIGLQCYFRAKHQTDPVRTFTRMAWADSNKMGCTVQECGDQWHAVCLYSPPGNEVEQRIYIPGTPCSMCPAGTSCESGLGYCRVPGA